MIFAQETKMGAKIGIAAFTTTGKQNYDNVSLRLSYDCGFQMQFPFSTNWAIVSEVNFLNRYKEEQIDGMPARINESFLEIPLMINLTIPKEKFNFFLRAGGNVGILLQQDIYFQTSSIEFENGFAKYSKFGLTSELGVEWNIGQKSAFQISLRGNYDLDNLTKEKNIRTFSYKSTVFNFTYLIKLGGN